MNPADKPHASTGLKRLWQTLRRPSSTYSLLVLLAAGFVAGILFWGGFHTVVVATNTEKFCISLKCLPQNSEFPQ